MSERGSAGASTLPVFLVARLPDGEQALLDGDEARHAVTARRIRAGERLVLCDGHGEKARCVVDAVLTGRTPEVELRVERRWTESRPCLRVTVAQALVKGERGELAVELATEAGADALLPWRAARSVARWDEGERQAKALRRWRGTAESAAKQARRAWVPEVREPVDTAELAGVVARSDQAVLLDSGADVSLATSTLPTSGELVLVVGPEGGINDSELAELTAAGAIRTRLGPTVLRASSAATVALGAIGARTSRWAGDVGSDYD